MGRAALVIVVAVALARLAGCVGEREPGPPVALKSFALRDVHGMHGGHAIWAAGDGSAVIQIVPPGPPLKEKSYRVTLTAEQWADVERLVGWHHLMTAKGSTRPAIPDEGHPIIVLVPRDGAAVRICRWDGDMGSDFGPVYRYLLGLCRPSGECLRDGPYDWGWRPDGFEALW